LIHLALTSGATGTGQSVQWNGRDSTHIITPRISASTVTVTSASASTDDPVKTVWTDLRSRLEDSTEDDEGEGERQEHAGSTRSRFTKRRSFVGILLLLIHVISKQNPRLW
jgi:hypothetical protein